MSQRESVLSIGAEHLKAGEAWVLIAPNGSGKTRLLLQIAGRIESPEGAILVLGSAPGASRLRGRVAVLTDDAGLLDGASVVESVRWAIWLRDTGSTVQECARSADAICERLGIEAELKGRPTGACSRGEQRLASLAMALGGRRPALALLDEPLSGLDTERTAAVLETIDARRREGLAVVVATPTPIERWEGPRLLRMEPVEAAR